MPHRPRPRSLDYLRKELSMTEPPLVPMNTEPETEPEAEEPGDDAEVIEEADLSGDEEADDDGE